jgi:ubiquinone/menaquinone biosynthesis C-methylase UbiE
MSASATAPRPLLLEIGFGAGRFLHEMREANSRAAVLGVEESDAMAEMARSIFAKVSPHNAERVLLRSGDVQCISFLQPADFVLCVNVLDRVEKTSSAIASLSRATQDTGALLIVTALDYETTITPPHEQLDAEKIVREFDAVGCTLERSFWTQLHKSTTPGHRKVYGELVLILRKRG